MSIEADTCGVLTSTSNGDTSDAVLEHAGIVFCVAPPLRGATFLAERDRATIGT